MRSRHLTCARFLSAILPVCLLLFVPPASAQDDPPPDLVAPTEALTPEQERASFRLPPGFEAQLVASEPDIQKPMNLAFDARGRLWVTHSREYPYPAEEGSAPRDGVTVLSDFGPDGRARSISRFADGLNIPIGVLPMGDGSEALVHSIPNLYHMVDEDGDGKADRQDVWYASIGYRDTHGMASNFTWGFDGWIYGCHGFNNDSTIAGLDGQAVSMNSGNTYRLRPDGSHIEQRTWGQVNPFGIAFDPLGNLYSCDCHSRPIYQLLPGAYYPSFGKPHDGLGYGPEMCFHDHGSTGISGIVYYAAEAFPEAYRDNLFIGNVVTSRINRDTIAWTGSTPRAIEQPDFLVSGDPWFRPVDIQLGPDGALYVADFYNRIIGHYEVPLTHPGRDRDRGRIWRIVYTGSEPHAEPTAPREDWTTATLDDLRVDLGHANMTVQTLSANEIARRGGAGATAIAHQSLGSLNSTESRVRGLWLLHRLRELSTENLTAATADPERAVRVHAMRVLGEQESLTGAMHGLAIKGLADPDANVRRAGAQALGRHPRAGNLRPLLDLHHTADPADTHLVHVVRMSLREQLQGDASWPDPGDAAWNEADLRAVADVATGVHDIHAARFLLGYLERFEESPENVTRYTHHVARYGDPGLVDALIARAEQIRPDELAFQASLVKEIHQGLAERAAAMPEALPARAAELARQLFEVGDDRSIAIGLELASSFRLVSLFEPVAELVRADAAPRAVQTAALDMLMAVDGDRAVEVLGEVLVADNAPTGLRVHAANVLGQGGPTEARAKLIEALPIVSARLQAPIGVALAASREGAESLLAAIEAGKATPHVLRERSVEVRLQDVGIPDMARRLDKLTEGLPAVDDATLALLAGRRERFTAAQTDAERGVAIFEKNCAICHKLGNVGAEIGPQLDGIGIRGPERLIEDILDPNRNVDQAFRTTTLALDDGRVISGLLLREEGEILILADARGQEVRIAKSAVDESRTSQLSPMPADLSAELPEDEFFDLLAYLLSQRQTELAPPSEP